MIFNSLELLNIRIMKFQVLKKCFRLFAYHFKEGGGIEDPTSAEKHGIISNVIIVTFCLFLTIFLIAYKTSKCFLSNEPYYAKFCRKLPVLDST